MVKRFQLYKILNRYTEASGCVAMKSCLFVYGTLRKGQPNAFAAHLERVAVWLGPARLRARLYHLGHYPGAVASRSAAGSVLGDVYRLPAQEQCLRLLDEYEGPDFSRRRARVRLAAGGVLTVWYYAYTGPLAGAHFIRDGDYLAWTRRTGRVSDWPEIAAHRLGAV
jgi:gamma-glutamylcyclotransferase (GGCT)/AIG2-like uncharacterized protein YtfP